MTSADIKYILEQAGPNPVQFVSANLTFIFTKDKYSTVFLDYDKQRMAVLRPYNESMQDNLFPYEITFVMFDQIETASILLRPSDAKAYVKNHESQIIYGKTAEEIIKEINESPDVQNYDPKPYSKQYEVKRAPQRSQIIKL